MTVSRGLCGTSHFSCSFFMPFSLDFVIFVYFTNFKFLNLGQTSLLFDPQFWWCAQSLWWNSNMCSCNHLGPRHFASTKNRFHCGVVAKFHSRNPLGTLCVSDRSRFSLIRILTSLLQPSPHFLGVRSLPRVRGANFVFAHATISPLSPCQIQSDCSPWHAWCSLCDMIL